MSSQTPSTRRLAQLTRHVTSAPVVATSPPLSLDLSGQVALVTGGVRGIGRAIAERLARNGATLVICDMDADAVEIAAAELTSAHLPPPAVAALGVRCNVTSTRDVANLMATIDEHFGRLDIVVNNAGINVGATPELGRLPVDQFRRSDWDNIIAVDLTGSFDVAQRAIPLLRKAGGGRIVNIASVAAVHPLRLQVGSREPLLPKVDLMCTQMGLIKGRWLLVQERHSNSQPPHT